MVSKGYGIVAEDIGCSESPPEKTRCSPGILVVIKEPDNRRLRLGVYDPNLRGRPSLGIGELGADGRLWLDTTKRQPTSSN